MRFVRYTVSRTTGKVLAVSEQDTPFEISHGGLVEVEGDDCEVVDLGAVEMDPVEVDAGGKVERHSVARQIHARIGGRHRDELGAHVAPVTAVGPQLPHVVRFHEVPCTMEGLRARLRAAGPQGVPTKARAWLASVLPLEHVAAMGLARGLPASALKAADSLRMKRDPNAGSRLMRLERLAQERSDSTSRARLRARQDKAVKAAEKAARKAGQGGPVNPLPPADPKQKAMLYLTYPREAEFRQAISVSTAMTETEAR